MSRRYPESAQIAKNGKVLAREIQRGGVAFGYPKDTETTEVAPPVWVRLISSMAEHIDMDNRVSGSNPELSSKMERRPRRYQKVA